MTIIKPELLAINFKENSDTKALIKTQRVHSSFDGSVALHANSIAIKQTCSHEKVFWNGFRQLFEKGCISDLREAEMYTIIF